MGVDWERLGSLEWGLEDASYELRQRLLTHRVHRTPLHIQEGRR